MAAELNLDDYRGDFLGKVGNIQDFSREFLVKLARVFEDTQLFAYQSWATACGARVGAHEAWDLAAEISRGCGRQVMPMSRHVAREGMPQHRVEPFDCSTDDLTKEALIRLIKTYWDQWLKFGNEWVERIIAKGIGARASAEIAEEAYRSIAAYEMPKLARVCRIEPRQVIDFIKLANLGIDATRGYQGEWEVLNPDHVVLRMYRCEVMQKYREEGVFDSRKARWMCRYEAMISGAFFPGTKIDIKLPPADLKVPEGEPFCIWTYTREAV